MVDPLSKSELFYPVRSQRWTVNRGETHGTLQAGSDGCGVSHSEFAVQGGYLLLLKLLFCRNLIGGCETKKRPTARSKKSTWFQTAIPIIMSSACHAQKKASGVKMNKNLVLQRKWLSQVLQRKWPIATWGFGKCLPPSPQIFDPYPATCSLQQPPTIRKNSWKPWNEVKKITCTIQ